MQHKHPRITGHSKGWLFFRGKQQRFWQSRASTYIF